MDVLRTKSVDGIHKQLAMFAILYNGVRLVMLEAAQRQGVIPDRISFVDALRWLVAAGTGLPLQRIRVLPLRPDRHEPRVRKRRPKNYPLMTKPRAELMQALSAQRLKPSLRAIRGSHLFARLAVVALHPSHTPHAASGSDLLCQHHN